MLVDTKQISPDRAIQKKELGDRIRKALEQLPEPQKEILVLRHFEEMSLQEIAEHRGCPLGTVKSALHRATRSFKQILVDMEVLAHEPM